MEARSAKLRSTIRFCIATVVAVLTVIAVWKFIDYRTQPPPPPNPLAPAKAL